MRLCAPPKGRKSEPWVCTQHTHTHNQMSTGTWLWIILLDLCPSATDFCVLFSRINISSQQCRALGSFPNFLLRRRLVPLQELCLPVTTYARENEYDDSSNNHHSRNSNHICKQTHTNPNTTQLRHIISKLRRGNVGIWRDVGCLCVGCICLYVGT